jgi:hypothetical protein
MTPHIEKYFTAGDAVRDIVIGMSDGLTVPFALAARLTGAILSLDAPRLRSGARRCCVENYYIFAPCFAESARACCIAALGRRVDVFVSFLSRCRVALRRHFSLPLGHPHLFALH